MAAVTDWDDHISPHAPECSAGEKRRAIVDTCMEFCRKTHLWTSVLLCADPPTYDFTITADQNEFDLTAVADADGAGTWLATNSAQIVSIQSVKAKIENSDDTESDDDQFTFLTPITKEVWDNRDSGNWIYREAAYPTAFYITADRVLYLYPIPTETSLRGLQITAFLEPTRASTTVPDFIYENYFQTILDGTLAILLKTPGQAWTDVTLGHQRRLAFLESMADDKNVHTRGRTVRSLRVTPRRFV